MLQPIDTDWLNGYKKKTSIYTVYKKPTSDLKTHIDWNWEDGKIFSMRIENESWSNILISDKIDLKRKKNTRDKEGRYIMIKGSIQEEDVTIVNIYAPNIGTPQYQDKH